MEISLTVNGKNLKSGLSPNSTLLNFLREHGYKSVKRGCETGECGSCAVIVDGVPRASCITLAIQAHERELTTVEALSNRPELSELQKRFIEVGAIQCGYCTPALLLLADDLLKNSAEPTEEEIRDAISGVLCRCTGYVKPLEAIRKVSRKD